MNASTMRPIWRIAEADGFKVLYAGFLVWELLENLD